MDGPLSYELISIFISHSRIDRRIMDIKTALRISLAAGFACRLAFAVPRPASAALQTTIWVGGSFTTFRDGVIGEDPDATANNQITITASLGGYLFNVVTSLTNSPGVTDLASLSINSVSISSTGGATSDTIMIVASANGFTPPAARAV